MCVSTFRWNVNPAVLLFLLGQFQQPYSLSNRASVDRWPGGRIYLSHKVIVPRKAIGSFRSPERAQQNAMFVRTPRVCSCVDVRVNQVCGSTRCFTYGCTDKRTSSCEKSCIRCYPPSVGKFVLRLSSMQSSQHLFLPMTARVNSANSNAFRNRPIPAESNHLPIIVKFTMLFLVWATIKSTRHRYTPLSGSRAFWTASSPGCLSNRKYARWPNTVSSDHRLADVTSRPRVSALEERGRTHKKTRLEILNHKSERPIWGLFESGD